MRKCVASLLGRRSRKLHTSPSVGRLALRRSARLAMTHKGHLAATGKFCFLATQLLAEIFGATRQVRVPCGMRAEFNDPRLLLPFAMGLQPRPFERQLGRDPASASTSTHGNSSKFQSRGYREYTSRRRLMMSRNQRRWVRNKVPQLSKGYVKTRTGSEQGARLATPAAQSQLVRSCHRRLTDAQALRVEKCFQ